MPINFEGANVVFEKPQSMTDEQCCSLPAFKGVDIDGNNFIATLWQPNKEDIEAINRGEPIVLKVMGTQLFPICLFTCDEKGNPNN